MRRKSMKGVVARLAVFVAVCLAVLVGLVAVFGQLRVEPGTVYQAEFSNVSSLEGGNFVRIAGVEVGKVRTINLKDDGTVVVHFSADDSVVLTEGTRAVVRYDNLIGGRYLALEEGAGGTARIKPGGTIPKDHTAPALDLDALIGGFRPLFRALDPDQVNALSGELIQAFQGEGPTIGSLLRRTAALTNTVADRDELIGQVITNLNSVLGSLGDQSDKFDKAVTSLSELVSGLAERRTDIANAVANTSAATGSIADLLSQSRAPLNKIVRETDRASAIVVSDHEYVENLIDTLPEAYQVLSRQGLYGDYFSFYLCDLYLKINGKGGQPMFVKLAGQDTGRCTPK